MLVSVVWLAPAALATIDQIAQRRLAGEPPAGPGELLWAGGDWLVYAFLTPPIFAASRRWPIARPHVTRRALLHFLFALLFCAAWATGGKLLQAVLGLLFRPQQVRAMVKAAGDQFWQKAWWDLLSWIFTTLPFGVVVYLCIAGIAHAIRYFVEANERELQVARLSEQLSGARFAALQAQLNPHFLFNTLNTIAVLVRDDDRTGAVRIVEQLGDVLRRTLSRHRTNEVTLEEELELVRQYVAIERARFSDRLRPTFDIDDAVRSAAVPSFAVQHLVENAVRHGIAKRSDAGRVDVAAHRAGDLLQISVTDDGPGVDAQATMPQAHGIENTRERLRALYGGRASLDIARAATGGTIATLRIPYREMLLEPDDAAR
jgi:sensor histidine kinase YesM